MSLKTVSSVAISNIIHCVIHSILKNTHSMRISINLQQQPEV